MKNRVIQDNTQLETKIRQEISNKTHIFKEDKEYMKVYAKILDEAYDKKEKDIFIRNLIYNREYYFSKILSNKGIEEVFQAASYIGHKEIVESFITITNPIQLQEMIADNKYYAFMFAAENGHVEIVKLLSNIVEDKQKMIAADNYYAFRSVAAHGYVEIAKLLLIYTINSPKLQDMIAAKDYEAFRFVARNGHMDVVKHIYMVAEDTRLPLSELDKILFDKKDFDLDKFKEELAEYRFDYINKPVFDAVKAIKNFMLTSKNERLKLAGIDNNIIPLPYEITKHILSYVIGDNGLPEQINKAIIELVNNNKRDKITRRKQDESSKKTFVEQLSGGSNKKICIRN